MKKLYAALLALVLAAGSAHAADEKVFDLHENFSSCSQSSTYDREYTTVWTSSSSSGIALYNYSISYYNDFLTTPDIELHAGTEYVVKTTLAAYDSYYNTEAKLNILLGQGEDPEQFRVLKALESTETQDTASPQEVSFMVPESGNYRLSFQGTKALKLLNTALWDRGASTVPAPAADFTLTPDPDGAVKVDISFTVPGTTLTGQDLGDCSYRLFRGVQKIKEAAAAKGEKVTFSETRGEAGNVTYAVEVVAGDQTSERLSGIVYLGPETPSAPADIVLSYADGLYNLSWAAPVKGIHDAPLDPARLTYTVSRILDGESTVVAANISATSFSEAIEPAGLQTLKYAVTAKYAAPALESAAAESAPLRIGSLALPFADSFAGATMSDLWDNVCVNNPTTSADILWQAKATSTKSGDATAPADADGGFLYYNSFDARIGCSARISTPPFAFTEGDKPMVSFQKWNRGGYYAKNDKLYVQISADNGEWINVPEAEFNAAGEPSEAWATYNFSLADLIPAGTKTYRVAFYAVSDYGQSLMIDCVRLFNQVDKDLEISSATIEESLLAGNEATLLVKVTNNGTSEVPADGYSLEVISDFPALIALPELEAIPSLGSKEYAIAIPVNSVHILNADSFSFQAKVSMAGDEVPANDLSAEASLAVAHSEGTPASGLTAAIQPDKSVLLSWTPAKDLEYQPVNITEDFDDESFTEKFTGPFNGWTVVDMDGQTGDNWYTASGSIFNITNGNTPSGSTGNFLGVTVANSRQQDDWIISPVIACKDGREMKLSLKAALGNKSKNGSNRYNIELLYSTEEEFDILNPSKSFTESAGSISSSEVNDLVLPVDNKWHEISFAGIPAGAKRVALHFTTRGSYGPAMWVDDLKLTEVDNNPLLGYHIYDVNAADKLNAELIGADETSYTIPAAPEARTADGRPVFVSAVYADGEAQPSNILNLAEVTGIEDITVDEASEADARWYNLQGIEMRGKLAPGIYIRRTASSATKVIVR